jgi:alpha-glucosidase (family GH31 glycosyl hydrolase)
VRWAQLALLGPLVSGPESSSSSGPGTLSGVLEAYTALRHRLLPYLRHCAHETASSGLPMLRPLLLEHSWDAEAVEIDDQLMLGRDLLIAPIFSDANDPVTRRVYLPGYANWYEWWTGRLFEGRQWIETTAPLGRLPLYVRAGTAIPLTDPRERFGDAPVEVTRLLLFAPKDGAIGSAIELGDDEMMGVEQERGDGKARLYLEGIPGSIRDLEIVGLSANATLVDASAPSIALEPSDGLLPGQGASWASLTLRLDQGAFTAGLELSW